MTYKASAIQSLEKFSCSASEVYRCLRLNPAKNSMQTEQRKGYSKLKTNRRSLRKL